MISIPLNLRGIIAALILLIALMVFHIQMNSKQKFEYEKTTGQIVYLDKQLGKLPITNPGKYRYLKIQGYEFPFEIFVGNESGDFKPKFEQIDSLKVGDNVTVFYYQTNNTKEERINRFTQFIDKGDKSYFERGNSGKTVGFFVIFMCVFFILAAIILWKMKKIKY
ncbi:MAG: DUF3592 domain-containing protein [Ferruginibacter sp.]